MSKTEENTEKKVLTFFVIFFSNFDNYPSLKSMKKCSPDAHNCFLM
ncbi:hypothetical protein OIU78_001179 [Salix suchowensis]|nr:hypothetical protein OIU78_001179 [Salix suchowensis]